jgi:undecaprenyl-diphosphatase
VTDTVPQAKQPITRRGVAREFGPPPRVSTVVLAGAAAVLTVLVAAVWAPLMVLDNLVVQAPNSLMAAHPGLVTAVDLVTDIGDERAVQMLTGVVVVGALLARWYRAAAYVLVCWLVEYVVENGLKHLVGRPRPVLPVELTHVTSGSFPSGHTMGTTVIAVSMVVVLIGLLDRRWWRLLIVAGAAVVVAAVATSRVLLGAHFPSDVVGAALLGTLLALVLVPIAGPRRE